MKDIDDFFSLEYPKIIKYIYFIGKLSRRLGEPRICNLEKFSLPNLRHYINIWESGWDNEEEIIE